MLQKTFNFYGLHISPKLHFLDFAFLELDCESSSLSPTSQPAQTRVTVTSVKVTVEWHSNGCKVEEDLSGF